MHMMQGTATVWTLCDEVSVLCLTCKATLMDGVTQSILPIVSELVVGWGDAEFAEDSLLSFTCEHYRTEMIHLTHRHFQLSCSRTVWCQTCTVRNRNIKPGSWTYGEWFIDTNVPVSRCFNVMETLHDWQRLPQALLVFAPPPPKKKRN
jgi:hypothetical protein